MNELDFALAKHRMKEQSKRKDTNAIFWFCFVVVAYFAIQMIF